MEYIKGTDKFNFNSKTAVTIGKFDGLHRGHRVLIDSVLGQKNRGFLATVITFSTSPKEFFSREDKIRFILTKEEKNEMLKSLGIDIHLELVFDENMAKTEPEDFIKLLFNKINMKYLAVGRDFHFGNKGRGDISLIKELSDMTGFELNVCSKLKSKDKEISSTGIVNAVKNGNMETAKSMLGYSYFIQNKVISGNHIGRKIGYPTINIYPPSEKILPRLGVYATGIYIDGIRHEAMTNIGLRPTIDENIKKLTIESHVLNKTVSVNNKSLRVEFLKFIREEKKFSSISELTCQIKRDEEKIRDYFEC